MKKLTFPNPLGYPKPIKEEIQSLQKKVHFF